MIAKTMLLYASNRRGSMFFLSSTRKMLASWKIAMSATVPQHITPDIEPKHAQSARDRKPQKRDTISHKQRAESREQRAESREQRAESREQRAESREQRAESREQRAESREQRAESREALVYHSACKVNNVDNYAIESMAEPKHQNSSISFIAMT
ncbi:hypothetical protein [Zymobacter palmae]|uniref:hypothetical protein n=1 Tax=Zymobacter palmae TaxID=33074 RepID=UPI001475E34E|nr:hypothetical protein [Zymobacter palmae]